MLRSCRVVASNVLRSPELHYNWLRSAWRLLSGRVLSVFSLAFRLWYLLSTAGAGIVVRRLFFSKVVYAYLLSNYYFIILLDPCVVWLPYVQFKPIILFLNDIYNYAFTTPIIYHVFHCSVIPTQLASNLPIWWKIYPFRLLIYIQFYFSTPPGVCRSYVVRVWLRHVLSRAMALALSRTRRPILSTHVVVRLAASTACAHIW